MGRHHRRTFLLLLLLFWHQNLSFPLISPGISVSPCPSPSASLKSGIFHYKKANAVRERSLGNQQQQQPKRAALKSLLRLLLLLLFSQILLLHARTHNTHTARPTTTHWPKEGRKRGTLRWRKRRASLAVPMPASVRSLEGSPSLPLFLPSPTTLSSKRQAGRQTP